MTFVLDASVALTGLLQDASVKDAACAFDVLNASGAADAHLVTSRSVSCRRTGWVSSRLELAGMQA